MPRNLFLVYQEVDKFWLLPREATALSGMIGLFIVLGGGIKTPRMSHARCTSRSLLFDVSLVLNEDLNKFFSSRGTRMPEEEWDVKYFTEGYNTGSEEHHWMSR